MEECIIAKEALHLIDIKVYNAEQIGGCFTVITTSKAKIMIDYGLPLPGAKAEQEDFDWEHDTVDAVFITHYHGDHVGKILDIPAPIPIYMGRATKEFMLNIHKALIRVPKFKEEQRKWVELLKGNRIHEVEENNPITEIKGLKVTPYSVDHSAYDAYMYLIEADGKVVLHTGDFRGHGYRGSIMLDAIKNHVHESGRKVDYLITEGTMMGDRIKEEVKTEEEMQEEAANIFREHKYVFLVISSTNFDSLTSFYKAAAENDMRMYCYNYYFFNQLRTFSRIAGSHNPEYQFEHIYTVDFEKPLGHELWDEDKTQEELMREHGFLCVIKAEDKYNEWIERFKDKNPLVIYSMWDGYINKKKGKEAYNKEWADFFNPYKRSKQYRDLHTSGHATAKMIAEVINAVDPQEEIIPMHTENVKGFRELDIDERYKTMLRAGGKQSMFSFSRKNDYSQKVLRDALRLMEAGVLVVPNKNCIKAYSKGLVLIDKLTERSFGIIGKESIKSYKENHTQMGDGLYEALEYISRKLSREEKRNYFFDNIQMFIEIVSRGMPADKERMTSQKIAMDNMTFDEDKYSVCGWETALGEMDIRVPRHDNEKKYKKPEIDLVMVNPSKREMILVEYKCKGESMIGASQNIAQHGIDYMQILYSNHMAEIRDELLNAYNVYRKMKDMPELPKDTYIEYKVKVGFLFVDKIYENGDVVSEISEDDYKKGMDLLNSNCQYLGDNIVYIRARKLEDINFDEWKIVRGSGLEVTV